jgi:diguanylate cyclase (GGDEF)-like protein
VLEGSLDELRLEYPCHSPDELRWFELRATPLKHHGLRGAVVVHSPITQRKLAEQQLEFMAWHDELTGLFNRRRIIEALASGRGSGRLGILLIDLDHFKQVNDHHGHAAGNDVLCAVAGVLDQQLPEGSLAGRHGGDEFCVLLSSTTADELQGKAADLGRRIHEGLAPLAVARGVTVSVGATMARPREAVGDALRRADRALYEVKRNGRDGFHVA